MDKVKSIRIDDFDFTLPQQLIAQYPLPDRDKSRLLIYRNGYITEDIFRNIPSILPDNIALVFNDTKVIRARFEFFKQSGARIEIFCLEPVAPTGNLEAAMESRSHSYWNAFIGNRKRWKTGSLSMRIKVGNQITNLFVDRTGNHGDTTHVCFRWDNPAINFAGLMESVGHIPLPPYISRQDEHVDIERYQTVYASHEGSVAAPTAGLHFTPLVLDSLSQRGVPMLYLTLHVGAGTFRPVASSTIGGHAMHAEQFIITRKLIEQLLQILSANIIPVGTTTMRALESMYWIGVKLSEGQTDSFSVHQWDPYETGRIHIPVEEAFGYLLHYMNSADQGFLQATTSLMIAPGYQFKVCKGLITNFHLPKSTLLLLVSAVIGDDWKRVYEYAISRQFRFLSYGDCCLFLPGNQQ